MKITLVRAIGALLAAILLAACSTAAPTASTSPGSNVGSAATEIYVYKSPTCSCCHEWESYLADNGYTVHSVPTADMESIKKQMGVPEGAWSCHTAVIDGYVVEGHVPVEAILDLLSRRPDIDGIGLQGMPDGSPGMAGTKAGPFQVLAFEAGETNMFGAY